jgi:membrane-bound serine protease (ClpP class)
MRFLSIVFLNLIASSLVHATCTSEFTIEDAIGPATLDLVERVLNSAKEDKCVSVLASINTPGGNLQTTRLIVERILNSEIPVLCVVAPSGAHAGSAGAIILQACHVAGAFEATNLGAATPVASTGQEMPEDLRKKLINDTKSWIEGIVKLRGRNVQFAKDIVEIAKAVSAEEAKKLGAIDWVGTKKQDFLAFANKREVRLKENQVVKVEVGDLKAKPLDVRYKVLAFVTNPQLAYFIFLGSIGLLYFELTHPGIIAPGVVGAIGLAISLVSMHMLEVQVGGLLLIALGVILLILEMFVTSFGVLGIGGVVSFFLGSIFLYNPETSGYQLPFSVVLPTTLFLAAVLIGISYMAMQSFKAKKRATYDVLIGQKGVVSKVTSADGKTCFIDIEGEIWKAVSDEAVQIGQSVDVYSHKGFTLNIKPLKEG